MWEITIFASNFWVNEIRKKIYHPSGATLAVILYHVTTRGPDTFFVRNICRLWGWVLSRFSGVMPM